MREEIRLYLSGILNVNTKGCQRLIDTLEHMILHRPDKKHASPYRAVAEKRGEKYGTVAKSVARTTDFIWRLDQRISKGSQAPAPSPMTVLGELIFQITGKKYM